jgi:hypothetical protein
LRIFTGGALSSTFPSRRLIVIHMTRLLCRLKERERERESFGDTRGINNDISPGPRSTLPLPGQ